MLRFKYYFEERLITRRSAYQWCYCSRKSGSPSSFASFFGTRACRTSCPLSLCRLQTAVSVCGQKLKYLSRTVRSFERVSIVEHSSPFMRQRGTHLLCIPGEAALPRLTNRQDTIIMGEPESHVFAQDLSADSVSAA